MACYFEPKCVMCSSFSNILIIFSILPLSLYQKFSRKHQFCQHYIQLFDARRVHFVPNKQIGKLDSHHSTMGSMMEIFLRLVNYFITFADPEMAYMCLDDNNLAMEDEAEVDGAQIQELGSEEEGERF